MNRYLPKTSPDLGLLLLRLMLAAVFLFHGSQKLFGWFGGPGLEGFTGYMEHLGIPLPTVSATMAALAEFGGGLALLSGVFLRPMMIPVAATMLVAAFVAHGDKGFSNQGGGYEYPLTLAIASLALFFTGAGRFAVQPSPQAREALA